MKNILLALCLLLSGLAWAEPVTSGGPCSPETYSTVMNMYRFEAHAITSSAAVDLDGKAGCFIFSSGTTGTFITIKWSHDNSTFTNDSGGPIMHGDNYYEQKGRYLKIYAGGLAPGTVTAKVGICDGLQVQGTLSVSGPVSITSTPPVTGSVGVTSIPRVYFSPLSFTTRNVLTQTATSLNLTTLAGVSDLVAVSVIPQFGGSGVKVAFTNSATAPTSLNLWGYPISTSPTVVPYFGPYGAGTHMHIQGSGVAAVDVTLVVDRTQAQ